MDDVSAWVNAQRALVDALKVARDAGVDESEAMNALEDVYQEDDVAYD